jgi:hypothetical protein
MTDGVQSSNDINEPSWFIHTFALTGAFQSNKYLAKPSVERVATATERTQKVLEKKKSTTSSTGTSAMLGNLKFCDRTDGCL